MKVQFELVIGENKFTLSEDVDSHADFFKKLNFYSGLPKTGPGGETDLVLQYRNAKTKDGKAVVYYSIVSQKAKKEFKFGQSQTVQGGLFPKGWEDLYNAGGEAGEETTQYAGGGIGFTGANTSVPQPQTGIGAPQAQQMPTQAAAPTGHTGIGYAPAAQPAAAPVNTPPQAPSPQAAAKAANILAKFGV